MPGRIELLAVNRRQGRRHWRCKCRTSSIVSASAARLVRAIALHAREAQRQAARDNRAVLDLVERDLDDELRPDVDDVCPSRPISSASSAAVCHASISSVMPLNVLPSMTKPPSSGSRAPRCRLLSQPCRRPWPHSAASTTRSSVRACLILSHADRGGRPRTARRATSPSRLHGRGRAPRARTRAPRRASAGRSRGTRSAAGAMSLQHRRRAGRAARR